MPEQSNNPINFWGELKRRKVFRVIVMYAGAAYIIIELVNNIAEPLHLPDWTATLVILLLIIGFPVIAILSWIFDITPEGIHKTEPANIAKEIRQERRRLRVSDIVIAVLLVIVIILAYPRIFKRNLFPSTNVPSIGVLYLKNLGNEEDEYFSYGITEDIIIDLSKAGLIRVPAMNDILIFRESDKTLDEIAQSLNVRYILTGSLRNETGYLRLALQLVEPQKGVNIWSDRWEEPMENVSTVKGKVIDAVIQSLGLHLKSSIQRQIKRNPTTHPDAYEFYLKANYRFDIIQSAENLDIVRGFYSRAIELDSLFILAHIGLGETYRVTGETDLAMKHFKKALNLAFSMDLPLEKAKVLIAMGYTYRTLGQYDEASRNYKEALEIAREMGDKKTECTSLRALGIICDDHNQFDEAMNFFQQSLLIARELEDENLEYKILNSIGIIYNKIADNDKALEYFKKSMDIRLKLGHHRSAAIVLVNMSAIEYERGNLNNSIEFNKQALEIYEKIGDTEGISYALMGIGNVYFSLGNFEEAVYHLERSLKLIRQVGDQSFEGFNLYNIANVYREMANYQQAMDLLNQALDIFIEIQDDWMRGNVLGLIGITYYNQNDFLHARDYLLKSVNLLESVSMYNYMLTPKSYLILTKIEIDDTSNITNDLNYLESIIDSTNIKDVDAVVFWNLYNINKLLGENENGEHYLEIAYEKVTELLDQLQKEKDRQQLVNNKKVYQEIIEEWEKSAL